MKTGSRSLIILLWFNSIHVLDSQDVKVPSAVTGYVGHDVTLPCDFIPGQKKSKITQVQWALKPPGGEEIIIIVFSYTLGVSTQETFLKGRVEIKEQSLIIKNVKKGDAGLYTCSIATFPSGSFEGTTNLVVQEQTPVWMLPRMIAVGVFVLIVLTMFTTTYFIIARIRREASVKDSVYTDVAGPVMSD
ncbi:nectin-1-like [Acanthopagrus latus]|uniref:nectin-1-like n=1 Tax=Acanthopagrus latus TaxID=8177 RepID=UPI00187CEBFC|nr:nectin-1-like [Acanthopagrus latus]